MTSVTNHCYYRRAEELTGKGNASLSDQRLAVIPIGVSEYAINLLIT